MSAQRQRLTAIVLVLFLVLPALVAACGGGPTPSAVRVTPFAPSPMAPQGAAKPLATGDVKDLVKQGQASLDANNLPEAEHLFKSAVAQDSGSADAQFGLGNVYFREGRLPEAETAYRAALAINPKMTTALSNLGVVYYQQDKLQEAEAQFNQALQLKPDDASTLYLLAAVKIQNKQYSDAESLLNRAKAAQPDLAEVYYGLGALYSLQGRKQEAITAFEKFLALGTAQDPQSLDEARKQLQQLKGQ